MPSSKGKMLFKYHLCSIIILVIILPFLIKESLVDISRQVQEALTRESLMQKSKAVQSKVTVEQLKNMTEHFRYMIFNASTGQELCIGRSLLEIVR